MAAVSYSILAATGGSGRVLSTKQIYGGTFDLQADVFPALGIQFDLVDHDSGLDEWEKNIHDDTKAIFIESISNPGARLLDVEAIAALAHKHGIPLIVDNTFATPYLFNPFDAFLVLQGIDTISERVEKETRNAEKIAAYLKTRKEVLWVKYPNLHAGQSL